MNTFRFLRSCTLLIPASVALVGCSGITDLAGRGTVATDPAAYQTPDGARGMYGRAMAAFQAAFVPHVVAGALLTDEATWPSNPLDMRQLPEGTSATWSDVAYTRLQAVRAYTVQAAGALAKYDSAAPAALRGHLFALRGYAEVLLGDLFCSGVPLSELEFEGDFRYDSGATTRKIYAHAVTLFDSALALSTDSVRFLNLARVGKGRALLALSPDSAAAAAQVVAAVPDAFRYQFTETWTSRAPASDLETSLAGFSVSNLEGGRGLPFRSVPAEIRELRSRRSRSLVLVPPHASSVRATSPRNTAHSSGQDGGTSRAPRQ